MNTLVLENKARKALQNMPRTEAKRIRQKMDMYLADPDTNQYMVKRIISTDKYRLRVGDYRVLFEVKRGYFYVSNILPSGSAYKR